MGSLAPNEYGLHDMAGNVWEWCWDWHGDYPLTLQSDPRGAYAGSRRVVRGGGWSRGAVYCRVAVRYNDYPTYGYYDFGFRVARSSVP